MTEVQDSPSFGRWLKARRRLLDLTQDALAARAGCAGETLRKIEAGVLRPSRQLAELLATQLDLTAEEQAAFADWARGAPAPALLVAVVAGATPRRTHGASLIAARSPQSPHPVKIPVPPPLAQNGKPANPYKGLRAFQEADAPDFFGRQTLIEQLVARLGEPDELARFLAVVGPSGSGKSSLVRAGLLPAIRAGALPGSERWVVLEMIPGAQPVSELAMLLANAGAGSVSDLLSQMQAGERGLLDAVRRVLPDDPVVELLLLIDQFEELFTLSGDETARRHFLDSLYVALADEGSRLRVVISLRADFYDRPLLYPQIGELLNARSQALLPMSVEDLERAIVLPAARSGAEFEPELVAQIVADVGGEPGALPLLEYALTELFEQAGGSRLTLAAYRARGGVQGALGARAEEIYRDLAPDARETARQLFLRLVTLGEGMDDTRRRVRLAEVASLGAGGSVHLVIERFAGYRLLTLDRDPLGGATVEVAHEALLRAWPRLHEWLENAREDLVIQRRLLGAVAEWAASGQDASFLATGGRLAQFAALAAGNSVVLNAEESTYVAASLAEQQQRARAEREQQARELALQRRAANRLRYLVGGLAIFLLVATLLMAWAVNQSQVAQANEQVARASLGHADALRLAAEATNLLQAHGDNQLIALLSLNSIRREYSPQADAAISSAALLGYPTRRFAVASPMNGIAISPDGKYLVGANDDHTVHVWDLATGQTVRVLSGHSDVVLRASFSRDGKYLATASFDRTARIWDFATGQTVQVLAGHEGWVTDAAFTPDGKYAATGSLDGTARLWEVATGQPVRVFKGHAGPVTDATLSPDGTRLLTASADRTARIWDVSTGAVLHELSGHSNVVDVVAYAPNGQYVATAGDDKTARLWDPTTGEQLRVLYGHSDAIQGAAFSPDSKYLLTGGDLTARLWDVSTGWLARIFAGHGNGVFGVAFTPDGHEVASGGFDGSAMLWRVNNPPGEMEFIGHLDAVSSATFSPDGRRIVTAGDDFTARIWDVTSGQQLAPLVGHEGAVVGAVFSPDGQLVLTAGNDRTARLWDATTGKELRRLMGHTDRLLIALFSPDGKRILTTATDGTARLYEAATGELIATFAKPDGSHSSFTSVAFAPDGNTIVAGSDDKTVEIRDLPGGQVLRAFPAHNDFVQGVAFSPDGKRVASVSLDGTAKLWDIGGSSGARKEVWRFEGHSGALRSVAFSPDGKYVLAGGDDRTAHLLDAANGVEIRRLGQHGDGVRSVAFAPDGTYVLTASADHTARLWHTDYHETIRYVCGLLSRDLTPEERTQYGIADQGPTCPGP